MLTCPALEPPNIGDSKDDINDIPPPEFPNFSVKQLKESKAHLLASSGKEYIQPSGIFQNTAEVKKARKASMNRVGLDFLDVADDNELDLDGWRRLGHRLRDEISYAPRRRQTAEGRVIFGTTQGNVARGEVQI